jgi:hypothetical protein
MNSKSCSLLAAAVLMTLAGTASAQILNPINVTLSGANAGDAIYGPVTGDTTVTTAVDSSPPAGYFHYVEKGYYAGDPTYGLPPSGTIVSASNTLTKVATFQLQGANSTNILKFDGTMTLATPAVYTNLAFLVNSLSANAPASFTLNFASGPSTTLTTAGNVPYWSLGDPTASGGTYALISNNAIDGGGGENGSAIGFFEYDFALSGPDIYRTLDSISVGANGGYLITYAVSGELGAVPEPSTWAMLLAGLAFLGFCVRRKSSLNK